MQMRQISVEMNVKQKQTEEEEVVSGKQTSLLDLQLEAG